MFRVSTHMLAGILFYVSTIVSVFAQEFRREINAIPFTIDGKSVSHALANQVASAKPAFADIDHDGDFDLFVGKEDGRINFYRNAGDANDPVFALETESFADVAVGRYSAPAFADIDNDSDLDLFVGFDGGINFYRNKGTASNPAFARENFDSLGSHSNATPTFADIDDDGDPDLFLGHWGGSIKFYRNTGNITNPAFTLITAELVSIGTFEFSAPAFVDIENDGDLDLFVGETDGNVNFFQNTGTSSNPSFALITTNVVTFGRSCAPVFCDMDNDGDFDLIVGGYPASGVGNISYYRNTGSASNPVFTFVTSNLTAMLDVGAISKPTFADIDNDGDFDLFVGEYDGYINFYRNTGTAAKPSFTLDTITLDRTSYGGDSAPRPLPISTMIAISIYSWVRQMAIYSSIAIPEPPLVLFLHTSQIDLLLSDLIPLPALLTLTMIAILICS